MVDKFRRHFLKDKDSKDILKEISEKLKINLEHIFDVKVTVEVIEAESAQILLINGKPAFVKAEKETFPTLTFSEILALMPKVVVDMGAVPHVCNGADIMAPGIVRFEGEFSKDDFVFVVDEKHAKPIAVGKTQYSANETDKVKQGIVVKNIHFVGDKTWNFIKTLATKA